MNLFLNLISGREKTDQGEQARGRSRFARSLDLFEDITALFDKERTVKISYLDF